MLDDTAIFLQIPVIVKAREEDGRRLVEVEASNEVKDSEKDIIKQAALLNSADSFVKSGHLDIDHLSEIGDRLGIQRPSDYIVGVPTKVKDLGGGRTGVVGELHQKGRAKADELWDSLKAMPPVRWQASIYGFPIPGQIVDCRVAKGGDFPEDTRYIVNGIDWRSLAFTRNPVNTAIKGAAQIVTAKSMLAIMKARMPFDMEKSSVETMVSMPAPVDYILSPRNREELMGHYLYHIKRGRCPFNDTGRSSIVDFTNHFCQCCGDPEWEADIKALALMHLLKRE